jgi:hypothetical protein
MPLRQRTESDLPNMVQKQPAAWLHVSLFVLIFGVLSAFFALAEALSK